MPMTSTNGTTPPKQGILITDVPEKTSVVATDYNTSELLKACSKLVDLNEHLVVLNKDTLAALNTIISRVCPSDEEDVAAVEAVAEGKASQPETPVEVVKPVVDIDDIDYEDWRQQLYNVFKDYRQALYDKDELYVLDKPKKGGAVKCHSVNYWLLLTAFVHATTILKQLCEGKTTFTLNNSYVRKSKCKKLTPEENQPRNDSDPTKKLFDKYLERAHAKWNALRPTRDARKQRQTMTVDEYKHCSQQFPRFGEILCGK